MESSEKFLQQASLVLSLSPRQRLKPQIREVSKLSKYLPLFSDMTDSEVTSYKTLETMQCRFATKGTVIIETQSRIDKFWMILEGSVGVYIQDELQKKGNNQQKNNEKIQLVHTLKPGDYFGQNQLIYRCKSQQKFIALEDTKLGYLDEECFKVILKDKMEVKIQEKISCLEKLDLFKKWDKTKVKQLFLHGYWTTYQNFEEVYKEGEDAYYGYIVIQGNFNYQKEIISEDQSAGTLTSPRYRNQKKKKYIIYTISEGELFGEEDLLQNLMTKRSYNIICSSNQAQLILLRREQVYKLFQDPHCCKAIEANLLNKGKKFQQVFSQIQQIPLKKDQHEKPDIIKEKDVLKVNTGKQKLEFIEEDFLSEEKSNYKPKNYGSFHGLPKTNVTQLSKQLKISPDKKKEFLELFQCHTTRQANKISSAPGYQTMRKSSNLGLLSPKISPKSQNFPRQSSDCKYDSKKQLELPKLNIGKKHVSATSIQMSAIKLDTDFDTLQNQNINNNYPFGDLNYQTNQPNTRENKQSKYPIAFSPKNQEFTPLNGNLNSIIFSDQTSRSNSKNSLYSNGRTKAKFFSNHVNSTTANSNTTASSTPVPEESFKQAIIKTKNKMDLIKVRLNELSDIAKEPTQNHIYNINERPTTPKFCLEDENMLTFNENSKRDFIDKQQYENADNAPTPLFPSNQNNNSNSNMPKINFPRKRVSIPNQLEYYKQEKTKQGMKMLKNLNVKGQGLQKSGDFGYSLSGLVYNQ